MKRNLTLFLIFGIELSCAGLYLAFKRAPFADLAACLTFMDYFQRGDFDKNMKWLNYSMYRNS
jgi:hypothetical protein